MKFSLFITLFIIHISAFGTTEIALTIDDAPRGDSAYLTGKERTELLLLNLKASDVSEVMFFCNTKVFNREIRERLQKYNDAGHLIANHTNDHPNLGSDEITAEYFIQNIREADKKLRSNFSNFSPYFRYPYLEQGDEDINKRQAVEAALNEMGYHHGFVTDETYDWHIDHLFQEYVKSKKGEKLTSEELQKVRSIYLTIMTENILFYRYLEENLNLKNLSPIKHTLLIHENDLNAMFLPDLINWLRTHDYKIISASKAYEKSWFTDQSEDSLYFSQRRIAGLAVRKSYIGPIRSVWQNRGPIDFYFKEIMERKI